MGARKVSTAASDTGSVSSDVYKPKKPAEAAQHQPRPLGWRVGHAVLGK